MTQQVQQRRPRRGIRADVLAEARYQAAHGLSGGEIHRMLLARAREAGAVYSENEVPSLRTLQDIVSEEARPTGTNWKLGDLDPDSDRRVLSVLRAWAETRIVDDRRNELPSIPLERAQAVAHLMAVFPDLEPSVAERIAFVQLQGGDYAEGLDLLLSFTPWREGGMEAYIPVAEWYIAGGAPLGAGVGHIATLLAAWRHDPQLMARVLETFFAPVRGWVRTGEDLLGDQH